MKLSPYFAICILLVVPFAQAGTYYRNGYSITIPNDWIKIPHKIVKRGEMLLAKKIPSAKKQHIDAAYQSSASKYWFTYPYATIQVITSGRLSKQQWDASMRNSNTHKKYDLNKSGIGLFFSKYDPETVHYNSKLNIIFGSMQTNVKSIGEVVGYLGVMPTKQGYIQVTCYILKMNLKRDGSACQSIIKSLRTDKSIFYKPN